MTSIEEGPNRPQVKSAPITVKEWSRLTEKDPEHGASLLVAAAQSAAQRQSPAAGGEDLAAEIYFRIHVNGVLPRKEGVGLRSWVAIVGRLASSGVRRPDPELPPGCEAAGCAALDPAKIAEADERAELLRKKLVAVVKSLPPPRDDVACALFGLGFSRREVIEWLRLEKNVSLWSGKYIVAQTVAMTRVAVAGAGLSTVFPRLFPRNPVANPIQTAPPTD